MSPATLGSLNAFQGPDCRGGGRETGENKSFLVHFLLNQKGVSVIRNFLSILGSLSSFHLKCQADA